MVMTVQLTGGDDPPRQRGSRQCGHLDEAYRMVGGILTQFHGCPGVGECVGSPTTALLTRSRRRYNLIRRTYCDSVYRFASLKISF
jgi:hypothetical protein